MADEEPRRSGGDNQESQGAKDGKEADKGKGEEDFLKEIRGYLMTVGTLFVNMAFQAALQPPGWMRTVDFLRYNQSEINQFKHPFHGTSHAAGTAPAPGPSPQAAESTKGLSARARTYMVFNAFTFATALWLVLMLMWDITPARAKYTTKGATYMMVGMGISAMVTFALGSSEQWLYTSIIIFILGAYAFIVVWYFELYPEAILNRKRRREERPATSPDHAT